MKRHRPFVVASSANSDYVLGLTVALVSVLEHVPLLHGEEAKVVILDGGLSARDWERLERSLSYTGVPHRIIRIHPDLSIFHDCPVDYGSSHMAYARLLLPDLLPEVSRLLYVDSDLLVKRSVAPIWEMDMGDKLVAATSCSEIQTLEKGSLPVNELELNPDAPYLQSGFMLMDLDGWRVSGFSEQCLEYLTRFPEHAPHWDQSAINGMIGSRWKRLDPMWNVSVMDFEKLNGGEVDEVNVLHYSGPYKPWKFGTHRWGCSKYFYDLLDRTEWSGWRPSYVRHLLRTAKFRLWKCLGIR